MEPVLSREVSRPFAKCGHDPAVAGWPSRLGHYRKTLMVYPVNRGLRPIVCLLAVVMLPFLSYPLSWLPSAWAQFRYSIVFPLAAVSFVVLLLAAAWAALAPNSCSGLAGRWVLMPRVIVGPCALLLASWLLSVSLSQHRHFSILVLPSVVGNMALFWAASSFSGNQLRKLCVIWLSVAFLVAVNGLIRLEIEPEFVSTIGNRNFLGAYLAAAICIGAGLFCKAEPAPCHAGPAPNSCSGPADPTERLRKPRPQSRGKLLIGGTCVVLLAALYCCGSRGAWLALAGVGIVSLPRKLSGFVVRLAPTLRSGLGVLLLVVATASFTARSYIAGQWRTDVRPVIWQGTLRMIAARPILGHGLGTFWVQYPKFRSPEYFARPKAGNFTNHAHNELLEVTAEQGIAGLAALLWLWWAALKIGIRAAHHAEPAHRCLRWGLIGATLVFMLHSMVDVDLRFLPNQTLLWFLLGLLVSGEQGAVAHISFRSQAARVVSGGFCLLAAICVLYAAVIQPMRADYWERQARLAGERGDLGAAEKAARQSLEIQPLRVEMRYFLAGVLAQSPATYRLAINEGRLIEEIAPDYSDCASNLGQLHLRLNQPGDALPYLQRAVKINPYSAQKRFALALAWTELSQPVAAEEELQAALRLKPDFLEAADLLRQLRNQEGLPRPQSRGKFASSAEALRRLDQLACFRERCGRLGEPSLP